MSTKSTININWVNFVEKVQQDIYKKKKTFPVHTPMNDRLTLLLAASTSRDCKVKPVLIYQRTSEDSKYSISKSIPMLSGSLTAKSGSQE